MKRQAVPVISAPITTEVTIPGSKSYTNRALLMAAMTKGPVRINRPLISDDTEAMLGCLQTLGIAITRRPDHILVGGDISDVQNKAYNLDVNLSGITIRFLIALACVLPGVQTIYGKEGLNKRPVGELVDGLRQLGADITYVKQEGFPPIRVNSSKLHGGTVTMDGGISSQYFSAMLMTTPLIGDAMRIEVSGEQISKPYIDMTMDTMRHFGITVRNSNYKSYSVAAKQSYHIKSYTVEGDVSSAAYFFAIAALTGSTITVHNLNPKSKQADMQFIDILEQMGNEVTYGKESITVIGHGVKPIDIDMQDCPDQAMTLAALAAFANGKTVIRGTQSLRVKETERVVAVQRELAKMGIVTESTFDTLTINGGAPQPAAIDTYGDHRMAMSFAVAGTKLPGIIIKDPEVVSKTFPSFWEALQQVTNNQPANIILIGMRGSGKNTIGTLLSERLGKHFVDMDAEIVRRANKTIPEIVAKHGWDYFRDQESRVAADVGAQTGNVVATGGGVILREANVTALRQQGMLVLLTAAPHVLAARIEGDDNRPPLTSQTSLEDELTEVWKQRREIYERVANILIATDNRPPNAVVAEIMQKLKEAQ